MTNYDGILITKISEYAHNRTRLYKESLKWCLRYIESRTIEFYTLRYKMPKIFNESVIPITESAPKKYPPYTQESARWPILDIATKF